MTIGQFLDHFSALEEGWKAWNECKVVIDPLWLAIGRKARLLADRTAEAAPIFLGVCDTRFDAATILVVVRVADSSHDFVTIITTLQRTETRVNRVQV